MEIKAGKYYKTRGGQKAYVAAKCPEDMGTTRFPFVGWRLGCNGEPEDTTWKDDGSYSNCTGEEDLVAEWREPVIAECDIVLFADGVAVTVSQGSRPVYSHPVVQRSPIRITEGKGIEVIE